MITGRPGIGTLCCGGSSAGMFGTGIIPCVVAPFGAMAGACADCWAAAASPAAAAVPVPCGSGSGAAAQASGPAADGSLRLGSGSALLEPNRNFIRPRFFCCMHCAPTPTPGSPAAAAAYLATLSAAVELSWQFLSPQQAARAAQRSTAVPSSHPQAPHTSHLPPSHPTRPSQPSPAQPSAPRAMWIPLYLCSLPARERERCCCSSVQCPVCTTSTLAVVCTVMVMQAEQHADACLWPLVPDAYASTGLVRGGHKLASRASPVAPPAGARLHGLRGRWSSRRPASRSRCADPVRAGILFV